MFPIRDHNPSASIPYVTYGLILINVAVFLATWDYGPRQMQQLFLHYGLRPAQFFAGQGYSSLFTTMFLHAGFMHLAGNMLYLWIFGDNLEDMLGHRRFLMFYMASGVGAALFHLVSDPWSLVPMVGASGAIAGVLGAYMLLYPKARVDVLFFFGVFFKIWPIRAWLVLGLWFGLQLLNGYGAQTDSTGTAYWAHIGGFIVGALLILPKWWAFGGRAYWARAGSKPKQPESPDFRRSSIPIIKRRR
jgi:membrane associated rhomboid family serine protease